jgi:predicted nucleic acid-binding protein
MAIAWAVPEQQTEVSKAVLGRVGNEGAFVPSLWKLEVANVLRNMVRRKQCDEKFASDSLGLLTRLQITIDQETDARAWGETRELAVKFDLTIYDAAYLELALRRKAVLATLDMKLAVATRRAGLEVLCN